MANMQPLAHDEVPEDVAQALAGMASMMGFVPNSLLTMARRPGIALAFIGLAGAMMRPGALDPELRGLACQMTSVAAGCRYCQAHGAALGERAGSDFTKQNAIWEFETSELFSEAERATLRFARDAAQSPSAVTPAHFDDLRVHFDDDQIVELLAAVCFMGWLNRWNDNMGTQLEPEPFAAAMQHLEPGGWVPGKHV